MVDVPNEMPVMGRFVCLGGLDNIPLVVHHEISQLHLLSDTKKRSAIDPKRTSSIYERLCDSVSFFRG